MAGLAGVILCERSCACDASAVPFYYGGRGATSSVRRADRVQDTCSSGPSSTICANLCEHALLENPPELGNVPRVPSHYE